MKYKLSQLEELEAESIFILRETFSQFENPCLLFSGGKDSIVVSYLAKKAFFPSKIPFSFLHIDTGHNFTETIKYRDALVESFNIDLIIGSVELSIKNGSVIEEVGLNASRNRAQTTTLLEIIKNYKFDAAIGGARRDEEKSRAKERFFSHRDNFGQWNPKNQRPELWNIFNGKKLNGEHFRIFPISNWTELDIWEYIHKENIPLPELYFSHKRTCIRRGNSIFAMSDLIKLQENDKVEELNIRFRTIGDITITGAIESNAKNVIDIISELKLSSKTERGTREDDLRSETSMEDRKKEGYF